MAKDASAITIKGYFVTYPGLDNTSIIRCYNWTDDTCGWEYYEWRGGMMVRVFESHNGRKFIIVNASTDGDEELIGEGVELDTTTPE